MEHDHLLTDFSVRYRRDWWRLGPNIAVLVSEGGAVVAPARLVVSRVPCRHRARARRLQGVFAGTNDPRNNRILYNPYKDDIAAQCIVNLGTSGFGRGRSLLTASSETESSVCRNDYRTWGRDLQNGDKTLTDKGFKIGDIMDHFNGKFDRPEDMTPGVGGKHVVDAGVAVANAQARGHSERLVGYYQSFKLLSQRKITRDEWPYLDYVLAFVSSVQIFSGPLVMH